MKENQRKCLKCGRSPADDPAVKLFRFPQPGVRNTIRCESWAKYCFPDVKCSTDIQTQLYSEHRMLCDAHFKISSFFDYSIKKLHRYAVPEDNSIKRVVVDFPIAAEPVTGPSTATLHCFPNPAVDGNRFQMWVAAAGGSLAELGERFIFKNRRICTKHFETKYHGTKNRLSKIAVPTLFIADCDSSKKIVNNIWVDVNFDEKNQNVPSNSNRNQNASRKKNTDNENQTHNVNKIEIEVETDIEYGDYQFLDNEESADGDCQYVDDVERLDISDDDCQTVADDDLSFYSNTPKKPDNDKPDEDLSALQNLAEKSLLHEGFLCNLCSGEIKGYRYTCVQCTDYDLCGSCEARGAHCLHYVLRIPRPKPYAEIQSVLNEIRKQLLVKPKEDTGQPTEIKEEMKVEDDGDPLRSDNVIKHVRDPLTNTSTSDNKIRHVRESLTVTSKNDNVIRHVRDAVRVTLKSDNKIRHVHDPLTDTSTSDNAEDNFILPDVTVQPLLRTCLQNATKDIHTDKVPFVKRSTASRSTSNLKAKIERKHYTEETNANPSENVVNAEQIVDITDESCEKVNTEVSKRKQPVITLNKDVMKNFKYKPRNRFKAKFERKHDNLLKNLKPSENVVTPEEIVDLCDESCEEVNKGVGKRKLDEVTKPVIKLKKNAMKKVKMVVCQTPKDALSGIGINLSTDQEYFNTCIISETLVDPSPCQ